MSELDLDAIERRANAATRGPWRWNVNLKSRGVHLEAVISGLETVMDFVRWGMGGARVRFQRDGLMVDVDQLTVIVPGREHHERWFRTVSHPDADFIAHAREDIPALIAEVKRLRANTAVCGAAIDEAIGMLDSCPTVRSAR